MDEGTRVELRITSDDTTHGFQLIGLGDINVEIPKRGRGDVRVHASTRTSQAHTRSSARASAAPATASCAARFAVKPRSGDG